jgi:tripartite-type tricarboxylate transporter receptor subunit TctC
MDQIMCAGAFFLWVAAQFAAVVAALRSRAGMNRGQIAWMLAGIVALGSFAEMAGSAIAQTDYPNRTIKIVVPVPPGPLLDAVPRIIADKLSARWGQPVIVENKPGGAQNLATEAVAKAAPDGYTLLVAPPAPLTVNQYVFPKLSFDPAALTPVSTLITFPLVVVVNPKLPVSNLAELIAYAKVNPGKLTYGSPGLASTPQLATESFLRHIAQGTLKPLAVTGEQRVPALQHVRTVSETIPGFVHNEWFAMVAPPQTPPAVVDTLSQAVADVLKMPDVVARLAKLHAVPVSSSPAETAALIKRESARWKEVVARAGIRIE